MDFICHLDVLVGSTATMSDEMNEYFKSRWMHYTADTPTSRMSMVHPPSVL